MRTRSNLHKKKLSFFFKDFFVVLGIKDMDELLLPCLQTPDLNCLVQSFCWLQQYCDLGLYPSPTALECRERGLPCQSPSVRGLHSDSPEVDHYISYLLCDDDMITLGDTEFYGFLNAPFRRWLFDLSRSRESPWLAVDLFKDELRQSKCLQVNVEYFCQAFHTEWDFDNLIFVAIEEHAGAETIAALMQHHARAQQTFSSSTVCAAIYNGPHTFFTESVAADMLKRFDAPTETQKRRERFSEFWRLAFDERQRSFQQSLSKIRY
jgi:hypothetical protein